MRHFGSVKNAVAYVLSVSLSTALLSACGGTEAGGSGASTSGSVATSPSPAASAVAGTHPTVASNSTASASTSSQSVAMKLDAPPANAQPAYHLAQVILDEPDDSDRTEPAASAKLAPHRAAIRAELSGLSSRRLTRQVMEQVMETGAAPLASIAKGTETDPMASTSAVTVYTPAQIRAAYGLPALPAAGVSLTSAQAAQLGAGQTIYLIDSNDDPNVVAELAAFNAKFGLPTCTVTPITSSAKLPLSSALTTGCVLSVAYVNDNGAITNSAPAYDSNWATEIAIDVQWAHATAPYARIVLIEAPDAAVTTFSAAAQLANSMGPGVVSMSFGAAEGSWTSSYDASFSGANMTYLAAAGDAGSEVEWPSVSTHVVAVAGTSLSYSGTGTRTETVWSGTGGGVSKYVTAPDYQSLAVPGLNAPSHREVSDVAFNADPNTGEYVAIISKGSASATWLSAGGTSLATPQWAGIIAVGNALRAQASKAPIGAAQSTLYGFAANQANYSSNYLDVTKGSDGSCSACSAGVGYDLPSGLGSPNVAKLLTALTGVQGVASAPVVASATVSGKVGVALTFSLSATDADPLTYALKSAPSGMSVNPTTGVVSWKAPVVGSYSVTATALDSHTGLSGQGTISVSIVAPQPPQVQGGSVAGTAQTALTFAAQVTDANAVTFSLSGAPSGMAVSNAGVVSWPSPMAGTYHVTVTAHDATTNLSGQGVYTVSIAALKPPVVSAASASFVAGQALSFSANVPSSNPLTFSIAGAPSGMTVASSTGVISWASPVVGKYAVTVTAKDTKSGLSGSGVYTITITPAGPVIAATSFSGIAGKALTGSVSITDSSSTSLAISISGIPSGMTVIPSGNLLTIKWPSPVTGSYSLHLTATDAKKLTSSASISVVVAAH